MATSLNFIPAGQAFAQRDERWRQQGVGMSPDALQYSNVTEEGLPLLRIASRIDQAWNRHRVFRDRIDERLLACLRARKGVYSDAQLNAIRDGGGNNLIWMNLSATKCRAASAWIRDIVMPPTGEPPFGCEPTPEPDLPPELDDFLLQAAATKMQAEMQAQQEQTGEAMSPEMYRAGMRRLMDLGRDRLTSMMRVEAERRAKRATRRIRDRMFEGGWEKAMDDFIEFFSVYPAAFMKGPFPVRRKRLVWNGTMAVVREEVVLTWEAIHPMDAYPAPGATDVQKHDFIHRMRITLDELEAFRGVPDYRDDQIEGALRAYRHGRLTDWLWTDSERERLEKDTDHNWMTIGNQVDGLHMFGKVSGMDLIDWGCQATGSLSEGIDPFRQYDVDAIKVGKYVIRCAVNSDPLGRRPITSACFDPVPGSIFGNAIPELIRSSQAMANASARALADNASISSGPQVTINTDALSPEDDIEDIRPWKIWQYHTDIIAAGQQGRAPIQFFQPRMYTQELLSIFDRFMSQADEESGVPRYTYGGDEAQGAGATARGLSMLMNAAAKGLRRAISQIDDNIVGPNVTYCYDDLMIHDPDPTIKGDIRAVAYGSTLNLVKDQEFKAQMQALQLTANPQDMKILGIKRRARMLFKVLENLGMDAGELPSDAELDQMQKAMMAPQPDPEFEIEKGKLELKNKEIAQKGEIAEAQMATQITVATISSRGNDGSSQKSGRGASENGDPDDSGNEGGSVGVGDRSD